MDKNFTISTSSEQSNTTMALEYEPEDSTIMTISLYAKLMLVDDKFGTEYLN